MSKVENFGNLVRYLVKHTLLSAGDAIPILMIIISENVYSLKGKY